MLVRPRYLAASLAVALPLLVPAVVSAADETPRSGCDGESTLGFPTDGSARLKARNGISYDLAVSPIGPGTFDIDTVTYDGYPERADMDQPYEQLRLQFLDADGALIDETAPSVDLEDNIVFAEWKGTLGQVVLDRPAVTVRAIHDRPSDTGPANSVSPACFGWTAVQPPTTTTEAPTTTEPTVEAPSSSTVPPSTTASPTTVPTQVLPEVQEMPDPEPVVATPRFTG